MVKITYMPGIWHHLVVTVVIYEWPMTKFPGYMAPNWDFVGKELGTCLTAPDPDPLKWFPPSTSFFLALIDLLASPQVKRAPRRTMQKAAICTVTRTSRPISVE